MFCEGLGAELVGFERFGVIMFFRKAPPQTEGRRDADPLIKTPPDTPVCYFDTISPAHTACCAELLTGHSSHEAHRGQTDTSGSLDGRGEAAVELM